MNADTVSASHESICARDALRAREFHRYLHATNLAHPDRRRQVASTDFDALPSLSTTLAPLCQLAAIQCRVKKAMITCMDRDTIYFLTEATMQKTLMEGTEICNFIHDPILASCTAASLKGRLCEVTLHLQERADQRLPLFIVPDLTKSRFAHMDFISGPPYYCFYAGTPIKTAHGINIGSLAIMDDKPRDALTRADEDFLTNTVSQIQALLETNRQAIEGIRVRRMMDGLKDFVVGENLPQQSTAPSSAPGPAPSTTNYSLLPTKTLSSRYLGESNAPVVETSTPSWEIDGEILARRPASVICSEECSMETKSGILNRAAALIVKSLDLYPHGLATFLAINEVTTDPSTGTDPVVNEANILGQVANSQSARNNTAPDTANPAFVSHRSDKESICSSHLDGNFLRCLAQKYAKGCLWHLGSTSSESANDFLTSISDDEPNISRSEIELEYDQREILQRIQAAFPSAHQVMFAVLLDATSMHPSHCLFVISTDRQHRFDEHVDISFLHAFCATVTRDLGRLDAILSDKQKSDFVGTISHELRTPLHGILASTEFLNESELTSFQTSMVSMIAKCGRTLLDTMNQVLDYSKINAFEKQWTTARKRAFDYSSYMSSNVAMRKLHDTAPPLLQIFALTDISVVLEEAIDSLVLSQIYAKDADITDVSENVSGISRSRHKLSGSNESDTSLPKIKLNIDCVDWSFVTHPGAIRRIILNLVGNALKYTEAGTITVSLSLNPATSSQMVDEMVFTVSDTGQGMDPNFLASRLFVPFSQENTLSPGTGLGLSIVHSIVTMLGGDIKLRSAIEQGTTVKVVIPLRRPVPGEDLAQSTPEPGQATASTASSPDVVSAVQSQYHGVAVSLSGVSTFDTSSNSSTIGTYIVDWYRMKLVQPQETAAVTILHEDDLAQLASRMRHSKFETPVVVLYEARNSTRIFELNNAFMRSRSTVEFVTMPCGPHKLAKALCSVLEQRGEAMKSGSPTATLFKTTRTDDLDIDSEDFEHVRTVPASGVDQVTGHNSSAIARAAGESTTGHGDQQTQVLMTPGTVTSDSGSSVLLSDDSGFPFPVQDKVTTLRPRKEFGSGNSSRGTTPLSMPQNMPVTIPPYKPRVLLVDDNAINLRLLETYLRNKRQYDNLVKAENGLQAVNAFVAAAASSDPFRLVFMDISMPIMNGFEATKRIREHERAQRKRNHSQMNDLPGQQDVLIVALTGLASGKDQAEGFACGVDVYMTKPVSFKETSRLLDRWEAHKYA